MVASTDVVFDKTVFPNRTNPSLTSSQPTRSTPSHPVDIDLELPPLNMPTAPTQPVAPVPSPPRPKTPTQSPTTSRIPHSLTTTPTSSRPSSPTTLLRRQRSKQPSTPTRVVVPPQPQPNPNRSGDYNPLTDPVHRRTSELWRSTRDWRPTQRWQSVWPGASQEEVEEYIATGKEPGDIAAVAVELSPMGEPRTYAQAIKASDADEWNSAMQAKISGLLEQGTWKLCDLPKGRKAIKCKWVYIVKRDENGDVEWYKVRLVAKGFTQVQGIDYEETFAPVARLESWQYLIALATLSDWEIHQIDFDCAYLNGELDEELYMEQPEGFVTDAGKVCCLCKAIYGLKQAGRTWFLTLRACLEDLGFVCRESGDVSIFVSRQRGGALIILVVYVDDLTLMGNDLTLIQQTKEALKERFKLKDLGELKHYLGIRVTRDRGSKLIYLDQERYIKDILCRFGFNNSNPAPTPLGTDLVLEKNPEDSDHCPADRLRHYRSLLGSLMYAMLGTRPDIGFTVAHLCQYQANPSLKHVAAAYRVLKYLRGTSQYRLCLGHSNELGNNLVGYTDADFAGDKDNSLSTSGWVYQLGRGAICWASRKQHSVARDTFDAEYFAADEAVRKLEWLEAFAEQIEHPLSKPIALHCDNKSAVDAATSPNVKNRTKHICVKAHSVHKNIDNGLLELMRIPGIDNPADILTKPLPADVHARHTESLRLVQYHLIKGEC